LVFGKDGYMYASFGDGGAGGDPRNAGQRMDTWLGKVLRIDVDKADGETPYSVPRDNPFVGKGDAKPEIWAYGLRNVWRMAFDRETGLLWGGDVGQVAWEEIDIIEKGGNYGWKKREGLHPYEGGEKTAGMIDPVIDYDRTQGISVTGGVVYRGKAIESLKGIYLYADYSSGRLWGIDYDAKEKKVKQHELLVHAKNATISSFGEDEDGEVYVCGHSRKTIWRLELDKKAD
jgi:glucose/arabinose dehydrogenase